MCCYHQDVWDWYHKVNFNYIRLRFLFSFTINTAGCGTLQPFWQLQCHPRIDLNCVIMTFFSDKHNFPSRQTTHTRRWRAKPARISGKIFIKEPHVSCRSHKSSRVFHHPKTVQPRAYKYGIESVLIYDVIYRHRTRGEKTKWILGNWNSYITPPSPSPFVPVTQATETSCCICCMASWPSSLSHK